MVLITVLAVFSTVAHADPLFRMRVEDLTTGQGVVLTDNGAGDIAGLAGVITFSGSLNGFIVNVTTGLSSPVIGGVTDYAQLDLASVNVHGSGPGVLRISLEDGGYNLGSNTVRALGLVGGTLTAPAGSSVTFQTWANAADLVPDFGADHATASLLSPIGSLPPAGSTSAGSASFGPGAFSSTGFGDFTISGAYSLFSQATLIFSGAGIVSFDQNTSVLPVQSSLLMLGMGLAGAVLVGRRRKLMHSQAS